MKIEFPPSSENRVIFSPQSRELDGYDQLWEVRVIHDDFQGVIQSWFYTPLIEKFLQQLKQCESERCGEAVLRAMDANEFEMCVLNTRSKGDFALSYVLRSQYASNDAGPRLSGSFDIDPSRLPLMVSNFEELMSWSSAPASESL